MTNLDILVVLRSLKMDVNLINFNIMKEELNIIIKQTSLQEINDFFNNYKNYVLKIIIEFLNKTTYL